MGVIGQNEHRLSETRMIVRATANLQSRPSHASVLLAAMILANMIVVTAAFSSAQPPAEGDKQQGPPPALVRVEKVTTQMVQDRRDVVGRLREVRRSLVAAELAGRIVDVEFEEGKPVVGGETVLARIDGTWAKLDLEQAEARIVQTTAQIIAAEADLERARRDLQYLEELSHQGSARPKEVRDARDILRAANAAFDRTKAELVEAKVVKQRETERVNRLTIRAPFDGVVVAKMVEVGQWVEEGTAVAEIISSGTIDAVIDVPERLINHVKLNDSIEVLIEPLSITAQGKVVAIIPQGSNTARTFPVKTRLSNSDGQFKAGMSVLAKVPIDKSREAMVVPRDAIQRSANGTLIWAEVGGQAQPLPVKVLFGQGDRYAIGPTVQGPELLPGMQVVVEGAERLRFPGQPLRIDESSPLHDSSPR